MIASLPMYDRPETRAANDRLWHRIRSGLARDGIDAPAALTRNSDPWTHWSDPGLVFSQTCSLPWRTRLRDRLTILASPVHPLDVPPGHYRSVIVMREGGAIEDGQRLAVNDPLSQSGWAAFDAHLPAFRPGAVLLTGAHAASARAVADGEADLAAIDAVTWDMLTEWEPWTDRLEIVATTEPTPALPFVCAREIDALSLRIALEHAVADMSEQDKCILRLTGIVELSEGAYAGLPMPRPLDSQPLQSPPSRA